MNCTRLDPERADAWFYAGQAHRLRGENAKAYPLLKKAALLPMPERSLFQWHTLYTCIAKVEFGRLQHPRRDELTSKKLKEAIKILKSAHCGSLPEGPEARRMIADLRAAKKARKERRAKKKAKRARREAEDDGGDEEDEEEAEGQEREQREPEGEQGSSTERLPASTSEIVNAMKPQVRTVKAALRGVPASLRGESRVFDKDGRRLTVGEALRAVLDDLYEFARAPAQGALCLDYRRASTPFLRFFRQHEAKIVEAAEQADEEAAEGLVDAVAALRRLCR